MCQAAQRVGRQQDAYLPSALSTHWPTSRPSGSRHRKPVALPAVVETAGQREVEVGVAALGMVRSGIFAATAGLDVG